MRAVERTPQAYLAAVGDACAEVQGRKRWNLAFRNALEKRGLELSMRVDEGHEYPHGFAMQAPQHFPRRDIGNAWPSPSFMNWISEEDLE